MSSYAGETSCVSLLIFVGDKIPQQTSYPLVLTVFSCLLTQWPLNLMCRSCFAAVSQCGRCSASQVCILLGENGFI